MLSRPNVDFLGGELQTEEADGKGILEHRFEEGDVVAFVSHKFHSVKPVTNGTRNVLVIEFWRGEERRCKHRCTLFKGRCPVDNESEEKEGESETAVTSLLPFRLDSATENKCKEWLLLWSPSSVKPEDTYTTSKENNTQVSSNDAAWKLFDE